MRLLIAPFENLSPGAALDWPGHIAPFILTSDLGGLTHLSVRTLETAAIDPRVNRVLRGYYDLQAGRLSVHATLENPQQRKTVQVFVSEGSPSAGILPLLDQIAKQIDARAQAFPFRDPAALQTFSEALSSDDPAVRVRLFQTATIQNPKFSPAYLALAETRLAQGDRAGAAAAATQGRSVATALVERAQFEYLAATAQRDLSARERAIRELVRLTPGDLPALRTLAEIHAAQRRFQDAAHDYQEVAALDPSDQVTLNLLGYMRGYAHDLPAARAAFDKYQSLAGPADVNPIDSLGEVYFFNGDFPAAERAFLEAHRKNPAALNGGELLKAAQAHLLTGDVPGADALFDKQSPPASERDRAQWEFLSGRRKLAMARIEKLRSADGDTGALATAQLSFWRLQTGDRASAQQLAAAAFAQAVSPRAKSLISVCRFLTLTPAGKSQFPIIDSMALILNHQFANAIPSLEALLAETNPAADAQVRTLLAWAYLETGKVAQAKPLVDLYPIPLPSDEPLFTSLIFPRFLQVRSAVLGQNQDLYQKLTAVLPDHF